MKIKSEITSIAREIGQRLEDLPDQVKDARGVVRAWNTRARRLVAKRPGTMLIGALALGFVLAKVARYA